MENAVVVCVSERGRELARQSKQLLTPKGSALESPCERHALDEFLDEEPGAGRFFQPVNRDDPGMGQPRHGPRLTLELGGGVHVAGGRVEETLSATPRPVR